MTALTALQRKALETAKDKIGFCYFLEMGLGKSLLALAEFSSLVNATPRKATRLVIVAPNSFKPGWATEISKHRLALAVHVYSAAKHKKAEEFVATSKWHLPPVIIVNYEALRLPKVQQLLADFTDRRSAMLVLDESIAIKNPTAKRTKAAHKLVKEFAYIRLLSGRPQTQGPHDLWAQLHAVGATKPGENFYAFRNVFCRMGGWENREVVGIQNEAQLRKRMEPFVMIAKKRDWLKELPDKAYTTRTYDLGDAPELNREYIRMENEFLAYLKDKQNKIVDKVEASIALVKYTKLQQLHCGFIHDDEGEPRWLVEDKDNPRLNALLDAMSETESKVCVCYKHRFVGEQLWRVLAARDLHPARITGGMKDKAIEQEKAFFNDDPKCRVMLLQLDSSKYGHTLIGDQTSDGYNACYTMLFYQNEFSLDTRSQIEDRIHRIGQKNAALYVDLTGSDMDRRMAAALQYKTGLYEALFGR